MRTVAGAPVLPLVVLFTLNLVDELDRVAFGVLSPEIRSDFGLTDAGIVGIGAAAGVTSLLAALPIGVLADRVHRVRLAAGGALAWSAATVLTALAPVVSVLALARIGAGTGRIVNEPVHASLLSDYYPPAAHPRVFALHRLANPLGLARRCWSGCSGRGTTGGRCFWPLAVPTLLVAPAAAAPARARAREQRDRRRRRHTGCRGRPCARVRRGPAPAGAAPPRCGACGWRCPCSGSPSSRCRSW